MCSRAFSGLFVAVFFAACLLAAAPAARSQASGTRPALGAGGVNSVAGAVSVRSSAAGRWEPLKARVWLGSGFEVTTGADGRVEILLAPGAYLRAGAGTSFQLADTSAGRVRVALLKGGLLVESSGGPGAVEVETAQTRVRVAGSGLVRVDLKSASATEVVVSEGLASVAASRELKVYPGIGLRVGGGGAFEYFGGVGDRAPDALDHWSRERAALLARTNSLAQASRPEAAGRDYEGDSEDGGASGGPEEVGDVSGAWVYSESLGAYTFFPFEAGAVSPYGYLYPVILNPGYVDRNWNYDLTRRDLSEPLGFRDRRGGRRARFGQPSPPLFTQPFEGNTYRVPGTNRPFEARPFGTPRGAGQPRPAPVYAPRGRGR